MDQNVRNKAWIALAWLPVIFGALLFVPAGTLHYWQGWLFLVVFFVGSSLITIGIMKHDPALLQRRMKAGPTAEKRPAQKLIMLLMTALFVTMFILSGIDHRLGWSDLPAPAVLVGDGLVALSYSIFYWVMRENSFASSTIELAEGQKVISTGPYRIVRHPMYVGGLILLLAIPLALGSAWALLLFLPAIPILIWRIVDEERFLDTHLEGYSDYCGRVKYRLVPKIY